MDNKTFLDKAAAQRPQSCTPRDDPSSDCGFRLIRDYIHDYCGIYFDDSKASALISKLSFRMKLLDVASCSEYYNYIKFNPRAAEEMESLIPHLTNNETYFFRELNQVEFLVSEVSGIAGKGANGGGRRRIRVLSCGCSSGEEAFTLAMLLEEAGLYQGGCDIKITGLDIDGKVIEKAERAEYTSYSLRATDGERIGRYFTKEGEKYRLDGRIRKKASFKRANLLDRDALLEHRGIDAILCRNVFIYFSDSVVRRIIETFYEMLSDDGTLLLGHSESLARITDIMYPKRYPNIIVYKKKGA